MKKIVLVLTAIALLLALVSCSYAPNDRSMNPEDLKTPVQNPDDDTKPEKPVISFDDPEVEKIYRVYTDMADRYTLEKVKEVQGKEFDPSSLFNAPELKPVSFRPEEPVFENLAFEDLDIRADCVAAFHQLRDGLEDDFSKYCKKYHPLKLNDESCYARIQINENLQELELSLKIGNVYYFFTNFYLDSNCNRHLEYEDGYCYTVGLNSVSYTEENGKATYPITICNNLYGEGCGYFNGGCRIDSEKAWEEYDIREAYDEMKYPFMKRIYSDVASLLIDTKTNAFPQQEAFREKIDATLYNEKIVGNFDIDGLNFVGQDITARIVDGHLLIEEDEYKITTFSKRLFMRDKCKLTIRIYRTTITREPNGNTYSETRHSEEKYYILSDDLQIVDDGVVFTLIKDIDLSKPACGKSWDGTEVIRKPLEDGVPLYEEYIQYDNFTELVGYSWMREDGTVCVMADLPNYHYMEPSDGQET